MSLKSQQGFSLVELMVVVAIIGILASVGIPYYSKFQARARQSEAKASLSALYQAEKSFHDTFGYYSIDLKNIGFGVQGSALRYVTGFPSVTVNPGYLTTTGAPIENAANNLSSVAAVNTSGAVWVLSDGSRSATPAYSEPAGVASIAASTAFTGVAFGSPRNIIVTTDSELDDWIVNENKFFSNVQVGL